MGHVTTPFNVEHPAVVSVRVVHDDEARSPDVEAVRKERITVELAG